MSVRGAADRRARINLGIRRRLAPLLEDDRRRIELMNSLMLSMPGNSVDAYPWSSIAALCSRRFGELTYLLTVPAFGFYWFALTTASDPPSWHTPAPEPLPEFVTIVIRHSLAKALASQTASS